MVGETWTCPICHTVIVKGTDEQELHTLYGFYEKIKEHGRRHFEEIESKKKEVLAQYQNRIAAWKIRADDYARRRDYTIKQDATINQRRDELLKIKPSYEAQENDYKRRVNELSAKIADYNSKYPNRLLTPAEKTFADQMLNTIQNEQNNLDVEGNQLRNKAADFQNKINQIVSDHNNIAKELEQLTQEGNSINKEKHDLDDEHIKQTNSLEMEEKELSQLLKQ